ncbi:hypothetical protein AHF37_05177 [Paragonimus kellicotti]|nr:hypothetical protein AHF37_05177 [Paragonimus kellicotti]
MFVLTVQVMGLEISEYVIDFCLLFYQLSQCPRMDMCAGSMSAPEFYVQSTETRRSNVATLLSTNVTVWKILLNEQTFNLHEDIVNTITCANNYVFSGSNDRTATCWNLETGNLVHQFIGHTHPVTAIVYFGTNKIENCGSQDADGTATVLSSRFGPRECVYTGSSDRTAKAWSVKSGKSTLTFKGHNGAVTQVKLDKDGKLLYTASLDGTVRSWHTETAKPQYVFEGHKSAVVSMDVSFA